MILLTDFISADFISADFISADISADFADVFDCFFGQNENLQSIKIGFRKRARHSELKAIISGIHKVSDPIVARTRGADFRAFL